MNISQLLVDVLEERYFFIICFFPDLLPHALLLFQATHQHVLTKPKHLGCLVDLLHFLEHLSVLVIDLQRDDMIRTVPEVGNPQAILELVDTFINFVLFEVNHRVGEMNHPEVRMVVGKSREDFSRLEVIHQRSIDVVTAEHKFKQVRVCNRVRNIVSAYLSLSNRYRLENFLLKLVSLTSTELNLSLFLKHRSQYTTAMMLISSNFSNFLQNTKLFES